ncbi:Asp-tRNA(Asn)/Glu-tRNA(Gln) amidotransferase subunit GatC [Exilibacterium tricleocarpae]|uniref:Aspartyl/glutamyl-tRNA(Asn/Gln) amidotransferase subunit C n=1 Tax=Exilibacterium tricleocarpae TaxID=2591008 RepID=A0A545TSG6_9GAMM|nr:Asp-tRNA(Asn)/Glu-tRNA(Gln) amidotransferase subunit GatC [Exilibacterium tricleocarpae]TQV80160.1 Asp-tRNA(Asn)/Glu-tRNA(Gln) amidotransferase subunit GatC [Exilibacterium tricleocarpae]
MERADIEKLAELARIEITDATIDEVTRSITEVLQLVDQLQTADTQGVEPMAHPLDAVQRLRSDTVTETDQHAAFQNLAPAAEAGLYLVPKVIDQSDLIGTVE